MAVPARAANSLSALRGETVLLTHPAYSFKTKLLCQQHRNPKRASMS